MRTAAAPPPQKVAQTAAPHDSDSGLVTFLSIVLAPVALVAGIVAALRGESFADGYMSIAHGIVGTPPAAAPPSIAVPTEAPVPQPPALPKSISEEGKRVRAALAALLRKNPLPADYKKQCIAALKPLSAEQRTLVGESLNKEDLYLPSLTPGAPAVEDATARIRYSYMAWSEYDWQNAYVADVLLVGSEEGFKLVLQLQTDISEKGATKALARLLVARGCDKKTADKLVKERVQFVKDPDMRGDGIWQEDNKWASRDDDEDEKVTITTLPSLPPPILDMAERYAKALEPVDRGFQGAVTSREQEKNAKVMGTALKRTVHTIRGYNEGGNMLTGTLPSGDAYAILGKDSLAITTFLMLQNGDLDSKAIEARAKSMTWSAQQLADVKRALDAAGYQMDPRQFLAAQDLAADVLAEDLKIPRARLCFVSQPEFHIDMFMRPLAPGVVMINDDNACVELIDAALKTAKEPWEIAELKSMRERSARLAKERGALVAQIKLQLLSAGLKVVSAPGVLEGQGKAGTRHVNFMNAVPGSSPGGGHFYATNATSLPSVREQFVKFMKAQGVDKVYFIGGGGGADKLGPSEQSLNWSGGLDCLENHHEGQQAIVDAPSEKMAS